MLMGTLLDENEIVMLDQIWNIVENMLFLTFTLILMLKIKNCLVSQKIATTEPTQTTLVWFGSAFILKTNQTRPHAFW